MDDPPFFPTALARTTGVSLRRIAWLATVKSKLIGMRAVMTLSKTATKSPDVYSDSYLVFVWFSWKFQPSKEMKKNCHTGQRPGTTNRASQILYVVSWRRTCYSGTPSSGAVVVVKLNACDVSQSCSVDGIVG